MSAQDVNHPIDTAPKSPKMGQLRLSSLDSEKSLRAYAKHLLGTLEIPSSPPANGHVPSPRQVPLSPSRVGLRAPSSPLPDLPQPSPPNGIDSKSTNLLEIPKSGKGFRARRGSFVGQNDELMEDCEETGCGEAVEILSRHSAKSECVVFKDMAELSAASYDIAKDGETVAVLNLIKTTFRLGETVLCVVTFNEPHTERRVLKVGSSCPPLSLRTNFSTFCFGIG